MKKLRVVVAFITVLLLIFNSMGIAQAKPVKAKPVLKAKTGLSVSAVPKVTINKAASLESPKGMNLYENRTLKVSSDLLQRFNGDLIQKSLLPLDTINQPPVARTLGLQDKLQNNTSKDLNSKKQVIEQTANMKIFADKDTGITRLIVDENKGNIALLPNLELIAKNKVQLLNKQDALKTALNKLTDLKLVPLDVSKVTANQVVVLSRSELKQGQAGSTSDIIQSVTFQRIINQRAVLGAGSELSIELGNKGEVVGFSRSWNQLVKSSFAPKFKNQIQIYTEIENTLKQQFKGATEIKVDKPRLVYFGNNQKYVQPAYTFTAVITGAKAVGKTYFAGVVAAANNTPEKLGLPDGTFIQPQTPQINAKTMSWGYPTPSIGRYVVRNDHPAWAEDANDFKNGLVSGHPASFPPITFGDYYWDSPSLWTSQEDNYVDKWNTVLMEGHGANWLFTTRSNNADVVNLNSAAQPGYGDKPGLTSMRYLILKGCSIVPAPPDRANWADPWWRIFKGLRQAIGFRTTMYINDDISGHFGNHLAQNCRILDSWFHATNGNGSYQWNRFWGNEVTGYGAIVMIPGHEGDTIYNTDPAPAATATGLVIWWQH